MRKYTIMIALLLVVALATPAIGASFPDVPSNHWAYEAINELVAAGVIEGYPDGTYKGQRDLTRYEIAMIMSRLMDEMAAEREELMDRVESMDDDSGLSTAQAQDVTAIVKALIQKNMPEEQELPTELTEEQANEVVNLIEALTFEYQAELKVLRSDYDEVRADLGLLEEDLASVRDRVTALENATPPVSFSGSYSVSLSHKDVLDGSDAIFDDGSGFNFYYIEEAPYDMDLDDYRSDVADQIQLRIQDLAQDLDNVGAYYDSIFGTTGTDREDLTEDHLAEIAVYEYNYELTGYGTDLTDYAVGTGGFSFTVVGVTNTQDIANAPYRIQEDTDSAADSLPMWATDDSDAMAFEEGTSLTHTLNLNADINYGGFVGQAGISLEKLDATDEVTFKSANLELENDELVMIYNEANSVDYSDFAIYDQTFNAASFLYKPWGLNAFGGVAAVDTEEENFDELDVVFDDEVTPLEDAVTFDGVAANENDFFVYGAQKTFVLGMADVKTTIAGRSDTDYEATEHESFESLVMGAEATSKMSGFDLSGDVAVSTSADVDEYGYMFNLDASTELVDAFTAGFNYKNRGENFSPLYGNDSVFDSDDAAYDKYGSGLASVMSGYGVSVAHDGSADGALVSGLDLDFGYDAVDYDGETENDTRIALSGEMAVMENLTVNGSYTQLDEPTGLETDYDGETKLYSVGAEFIPVEDATVSASYSVTDPVEASYTTANDNTYDAVQETEMALNGSYDLNDYVSASAGYTTVSGLDYYDGAEKTTTSVGVSLADYPIMAGLTGSASVDYESSTGQAYNDVDITADAFNGQTAADTRGLEDIAVTTTTVKAGLAYTLNDRTELTYDLGYTMQDALDDVYSEQRSGNYMTNELGVVYTFTENADLTADYKHMMMNYDDASEGTDWTAHQLEAGVSLSF